VPGEINRRSFLAGSVATAAAVGVAGAGVDLLDEVMAGAATNGAGRNGVSTKKPKLGGTLVFGVDAEESGFDPTQARYDEVGVMYARTVFDPLCIVTAKGGWAPYLAESVVPNADYTSWTVTLQDNLVFHDGTKCDGAALLTNFVAHKNSLLTGIVIGPILIEGSGSIVQSGPLAVTMNFKTPWAPFPYYLCGGIGGQIAYPVAPSMLAAKDGTSHPVGTGPFIFQEWVPNSHFTATKNPKYWRKGLPYLDEITYRPIPSDTARTQALESGTIDMMITDTPQEILIFKGDKKWSYIDDSGAVVGEPDVNCVLLNTGAEPFNNPKVRLAAAKAISAKHYNSRIDAGVGGPVEGVFVPGTPYYSNVSYPKYDQAGAKKLVAEVEKETGKPVAFSLGTTEAPSATRAQSYLAEAFQNVGMKVTQTTVEQNDLINLALDGKFQAFEWRQFSAVDPDLNYIFWSTTTIGDEGSLSINMTRNEDPQIEKALQIGRSTLDPATRAKAYQTVNQRFAVDLPYIWNDRAVWAVVAYPKVQNFNNPTTPTGAKAYGLIGGSIWPTQIWLS
jgi:peptide/nickel transport system substrate-binding protein